MLGRWRLDDRQAPRSHRVTVPSRRWTLAPIVAALVLAACGASNSADDDSVITQRPADAHTATTTAHDQVPNPTTSTATHEPPNTTVAATTTSAPAPPVEDTVPPSTSSSTAPSTASPTIEVASVVVEAQAALATLLVADPDPARAPYERDEYDGDGWVDVDGDCVNTRHEVLEAASLDPVIFDGCRVVAGRWIDRYSGETITDAALATIDHVIPLAEAHRSGAWRWDVASKVAFANDQTPGMLAVASNDSNQAKADKTPDRWLPPDPAAHCQYAIDWITTKSRYALTVTAAEANALQTALGSCTPTSVIRPSATAPVPTVVITIPTTTTTAPIAPTAGPGAVALTRCNARTEVVEIANTGGEAVSLSGYVLHDEGRKHEVPLGQFGSLEPGQRLAIVSGDDAVDGDGQVVWKRQNVWNNDGDVAHLVTPAGTITTLRC